MKRCSTSLAIAAAAKLLQSCLTQRDPIDGSPPGSPVPGILQARTLEWVVWPRYFMTKRKEKAGSSDRFPLLGLYNHCGWWLQPWNQKMIASWQESHDKSRQCVERQKYHSSNNSLYSQGYVVPSGQVRVWELDHREGRAPKNWCLQTVVVVLEQGDQTSQS